MISSDCRAIAIPIKAMTFIDGFATFMPVATAASVCNVNCIGIEIIICFTPTTDPRNYNDIFRARPLFRRRKVLFKITRSRNPDTTDGGGFLKRPSS